MHGFFAQPFYIIFIDARNFIFLRYTKFPTLY